MKRLYIIAGPNGAGKTTASYTILPDILGCWEFVNSDEIAKGLSPFRPDEQRIQAGKLMLQRIRSHIASGRTFAFETTLAPRSFLELLEEAHKQGYSITLLFLWLNDVELAVQRVETRVREGGDDVPEKEVRRRYERGLRNFFNLYRERVDHWIFADHSEGEHRIMAEGGSSELSIDDPRWKELKTAYKQEDE